MGLGGVSLMSSLPLMERGGGLQSQGGPRQHEVGMGERNGATHIQGLQDFSTKRPSGKAPFPPLSQ